MHLAFLTPEYPHPSSVKYAGLGTSIKNLARGLISKNIKVSVFVYGQNKDLEFSEDHISFYFIQQRNYTLLGWFRYRKFLEQYINRKIKENEIHAIEAPDWTGITAFMKFKCPLVLRLHGSDTYFCKLENRKQKWKNYFLEKTALNKADRIVSVSDFTASKTKEFFELNREIITIPNFIDTHLFKPDKATWARTNKLLYLGSLIRKKGIFDLAASFNLVVESNPNARLSLVGQDVTDIQTGESSFRLFNSLLSTYAAERIDYHGKLAYSEVKKEIEKASVLVFPSHAEALPMTWLEAMAMAKPLVTSNIGWANEIMEEGETGFMVTPSEHALFAKRIIELIENPEMALQMGKYARRRVIDNFSEKKVIRMNIEFYRNLTNS